LGRKKDECRTFYGYHREKIPLNELQNTKTGPLPLSPVTIVSLPSNTNKILAEPRMSKYI
jgi:hypothetical protein